MIIIIELALLIFSLWTVSYHLFFFAKLPSGLMIIPTVIIVMITALYIVKSRQSIIKSFKADKKLLLWSLPLIVGLAIFTLVIARPDNDDFSYYHRALYQLDHLDQPFTTNDTSHGEENLPAISYIHLLPSYEPFCALVSHWLGIDPLWFYQNGIFAFSAAALVIVLLLLFREFRVKWPIAILCTSISLLFLGLDGNTHQSLGVITLMRMWQGKAVIWGLFVSLTILLVKQYLSRPDKIKLLRLVLLGVSASGMSNGTILIPVLIGAAGIAWLLSYGFSKRRLLRVISLSLPLLYPAILVLLLLAGILPSPSDTQVWVNPYNKDWFENLFMVFGSNEVLYRNFLILLLLPFAGLRSHLARFIPVLVIVLIVFITNPVMGPLLLSKLTPGFFWRFAYLFPLTFAAGLIGNALFDRRLKMGKPYIRISIAVIVSAAIVYASDFNVINQPVRPAQLKSPFDYRFTGDTYRFNRNIIHKLEGRYILAPQRITIEAGLMNHRLHFYVNRRQQTLHIFMNAGKEEEARRRTYAEIFVSRFEEEKIRNAVNPRNLFIQSLEFEIDAIVAKISSPENVDRFQSILDSSDDEWNIAENSFGYVLWLKTKKAVRNLR